MQKDLNKKEKEIIQNHQVELKEMYEKFAEKNRNQRRKLMFKNNADTDVDRYAQKKFLTKNWNDNMQLPFKGIYAKKQIKIAMEAQDGKNKE